MGNDKDKALQPIDVIAREITEALRSNAYDLTSWLATTGESNPDKALTAYIKLLEASNKLTDLQNNGVNGKIDIQIIISEESKASVTTFLNLKNEAGNK